MPKRPSSAPEVPKKQTPFQKQLAVLNHMRALFFAQKIGNENLHHIERYLNKLPPEFDDLCEYFSLEWALIYLTEDDRFFGVNAIIEALKNSNTDKNFIEKFKRIFSEESYYEEWDPNLANPNEHDELRARIAQVRGLMTLFSMDANFVQNYKQRFRLALAIECTWFGIDIPDSLIELLSDDEKEELAYEIQHAAEIKTARENTDNFLRKLIKAEIIDQNVLLMNKETREKIATTYSDLMESSKKMAEKELCVHSEELLRLLSRYSDPAVIIDILLKP